MYKKLSQLSFVIGLFFALVSLVLFGNALINDAHTPLNIYTAIVFLIFGIVMIYLSGKEKTDD